MVLLSKKSCCQQLFSCFRRHFYEGKHPTTSHRLPSGPLLFSTAAVTGNPSPSSRQTPPFIVEYLIDSCGFSRGAAVKVSAPISHVRSPENPDSVLDFLRRKGLGDDHIRGVVSGYPKVLCVDASKTLEPKIRVLEDAGFSVSEIVRLISRNPSALRLCNVGPKIEFWVNLLGTKEKVLKAISEDHHFLTSSLDKKIKPNISVLCGCGISERRLGRMIWRRPRFITGKLDRIQSVIERVKILGIYPGSGRFEQALCAVSNVSRATLDAKLKLLKSFGWSEGDFLLAFQKSPIFVRISEKKIRDVMDFLVREVGCDPSYIVLRPVLLSYSMEKRLMPRYRVLRALKLKGLRGGEMDFLGAIVMSEKKFMEKCVIRHSVEVPGLQEAYLAAIDGVIRS